jgi:lipid-binding SYLF domain-containing protein
MRPRFVPILLILLCVSLTAGCRTPKGASVQEKRAYALKMRDETLAELYRKQPQAKAHIQRSPGYAVFSSVGSKILMLATGSGFGVATDRQSGKNTFMRMVEAGGGVGIGIKSYKAVYVFNSRKAFESFLSGSWQAAGDADVGAEYKGQGASAGAAMTTDQLTSPVTVYQFTEAGVALSAVATGTRYYPDKDLN